MEDFKFYINISRVKAREMTRGAYNYLRGWKVPDNENPDDEGYLVVNESVSERNVDGYDGYVSWLPKKAFKEIYCEDKSKEERLDNQQQHDAYLSPFSDMTGEEIVAYFSRYGFVDEHGHKLELCKDFLDLVDFAKK